MTTNYSTAVMLFNDNIRAIRCQYELGCSGLTIFKTLDATIEAEDLVIVPTGTRHEMTVVKVAEVGYDVDISEEAEVPFIVGKVHVKAYEEILAQEKIWIDALKAGEKKRKRDELREGMQNLYKDSGIESLQIANMVGEYSDPELKISEKD